MSSDSSRQIGNALGVFLESRRVGAVFFAPAGGTPPQLAYITPFPRLSLVLEGRHPMLIADRSATVRIDPKRDDAVFVRPNHWNKPDWSEAGTVMTCLFGQKQIGVSLTSHTGNSMEPIAKAKVSLLRPFDTVMSNLIAALYALPNSPVSSGTHSRVVESLLHSFLDHLRQPPSPRSNKAQRTFEDICLYLQENAHCPVNRESVAKHIGLSPSHVSRLFRTEGSMKFSDYLNLVRINRAKVLLTDSRSTIKEVAADCGYHDVAYFCRVFQRFTRTTPTSYRSKRLR